MTTVYLAGPISRVTYRQATEWRLEATKLLQDNGITTSDPMVGKSAPEGGPDAIIDQSNSLGLRASEIFDRDMDNITHSDILLINLKDFTGSIGTPFEMGRAWSEHKLMVVYNADRWMSHPFSQAFDYVALDLVGAVGIIESVVYQAALIA